MAKAGRGQLVQLISIPEAAWGPESSPETLTEEKLLIENEGLSPPAENTDSIIETETSISGGCLLKLGISQRVSYSRGGQKRTFNLVPNFNLLRQSHINVKERDKCDLTFSHGLKFILEEEIEFQK